MIPMQGQARGASLEPDVNSLFPIWTVMIFAVRCPLDPSWGFFFSWDFPSSLPGASKWRCTTGTEMEGETAFGWMTAVHVAQPSADRNAFF